MGSPRQAANNDAAVATFIADKAEIDNLLARIQASSDDHFGTAPEAVTWGHVGRMGFVTERLKEIAAFLRV